MYMTQMERACPHYFISSKHNFKMSVNIDNTRTSAVTNL